MKVWFIISVFLAIILAVTISKMDNKKVVYWESSITGFKSHGSPTVNAQAWADYLNRYYPDIHHRVE